MTRRLANPFPAVGEAPIWLGRGWMTRRRANVGGSGGADGDGDTGSSGDGDDDDDSGSDDGEEDGDGSEDEVSKANAKAKERMQESDRAKRKAESEAAAYKKKLEELEDKDKSALEVAERKLGEATEENKKLKATVEDLGLGLAFANLPEYTWKKPKTALRVAQAEGYLDEVRDSEGAVDDKVFSKKIKEFAKAFPELLKTEGNGAGPGPTGGGVGSGGKNGKVTPEKEIEDAVKKKYGRQLR